LRVSTPNEVSNFIGIWELFNHYHYTWNNPVNLIDLNGLFPSLPEYAFKAFYISLYPLAFFGKGLAAVPVSTDPDAPFHLIISTPFNDYPLAARYPAYCWESVGSMMKCHYDFWVQTFDPDDKKHCGYRFRDPLCPFWLKGAYDNCQKNWQNLEGQRYKNWLHCFIDFILNQSDPNPFFPGDVIRGWYWDPRWGTGE